MRFKIELVVDLDKDHPYIDSGADQAYATMTLIEDLLYDDDYVTMVTISVEEEK